MTTPAIHRPGCRTGTALISSAATAGGATSGVAVATAASRVSLALRPVDDRLRDRAVLHAPAEQDLLVLPVRDQLLQRRLDLLGERAVLRDRDAVRRGAVRLAGEREQPVRLLDDVRGDRGVGH